MSMKRTVGESPTLYEDDNFRKKMRRDNCDSDSKPCYPFSANVVSTLNRRTYEAK